MPHKKSHIWTVIDKELGLSKCDRCGMTKFKGAGGKTIYARANVIDNSSSKHNCFILSKD